MSKIKILSAAFFAVLAFGVISASSALAGEWLLNGALISTATHAVTEGSWLLLALGFGGFSVTHILCHGRLLGTVGPMAADTVTKVEGLNGETKINCEVLHNELGICPGSLLALVTAEHLPWKTELLLPAANEIVDHFTSSGAGNPAFELECTTSFGTKFKELCEQTSVLTDAMTNEAGGVLGKILNQLSNKCNGAGNVAHIYGEGLVSALAGTLSVS